MKAILILLLAGCTAPGIQFEANIPPNYEIDLELQAGQTLHWNWQTDNPVTFDVHTHLETLVIAADHEGTNHSGSYTAQSDGVWSLYWQQINNETSLTGTYRIS